MGTCLRHAYSKRLLCKDCQRTCFQEVSTMCFFSDFPVDWSSWRQGFRVLPQTSHICKESVPDQWIQGWMDAREREKGKEGRRCAGG